MSAKSPFLLENESIYKAWRDFKLQDYPTDIEQYVVEIDNLSALSEDELEKINTIITKTNLVIYRTKNAPDELSSGKVIRKLTEQVDLYRCETHRSEEEDGLVRIEVSNTDQKKAFIPYTTKALNWHTDGYYRHASKRIKSFSMHCVRPAAEGGMNSFFDHELAYLRMRDENPAFIKAFRHRRTMFIPAFANAEGESRAESSGGVYGVDRFYGSLHMRFTARKHNVTWNDNQITKDTYDFLMNTLENDKLVMNYKLQAGEGILCNNILHNRTAFEDGDNTRLMLRGRYLERIGDTCPDPNQLANKHYIAGVWS